MTSIKKELLSKFPEASEFGINTAVVFNGYLHITTDYELPSELFKRLEDAFEQAKEG
jgi:hypothetical protein